MVSPARLGMLVTAVAVVASACGSAGGGPAAVAPCLCCGAGIEPPAVPQRVFYVDQAAPGASDSNPGTQELPWLTISHAVSVAEPGDAVSIAAGVYAEVIDIARSGMPGRPIVLRRAGTGPVVIDGGATPDDKLVNWGVTPKDHIILDGLEIRNGAGWGIWINGSHNVVRNCSVHDHGRDWVRGSGILVEQGDHNRILGNSVHHNRWNGINIEDANCTEVAFNTVHQNTDHMGINIFSDTSEFYGLMAGNDVHHNIVYGNGESGIYMRYQVHNRIYENLIYGNANWGVLLHRGGVGGPLAYDAFTAIYNNTIADNGRDGLFVSAARNVVIVNNILSRNNASGEEKADLRLEETEGHVIDYNLYDPLDAPVYWQGVGALSLEEFRLLAGGRFEARGEQGSPQFVDRAAADFTLSPSSPAIDAGAGSFLEPGAKDLQGVVRPQGAAFDLGPYEFAGP